MPFLNVVVIGTGMYVCGRGTEGFGTIMPAVLQCYKADGIGYVFVAGRTGAGIREAKTKIKKLQSMLGTTVPVKYFPSGKTDNNAYLEAFRTIPRPACVIVAVPDNMHRKIAEAAIKQGLHVLVVKPLVPTLNDAYDLIELQEDKKIYCAVEFHKRYDAANLKLKDVLEKGILGDPLYFSVEFSQRKNIPSKIFRSWVESTNVFQYLGVHYADIIYFSTGALPVRVMALGQKNWLYSQGIDTYDAVEAVIEWRQPSGVKFVSSILTNWIDPLSTSAMSDQRIKVIGTKGRFESDQKNRGIKIVCDEKGIEEPNPYFTQAYGKTGEMEYKGYGIESISGFLRDVAGVEAGRIKIRDLEKKRPTFRNALVSTAIVEAVANSLRKNGAWMNIKGMGKI